MLQKRRFSTFGWLGKQSGENREKARTGMNATLPSASQKGPE